jgi:hypothetical protein
MWNIPAETGNVVFFDHTFLRHDPGTVRAILKDEPGVSQELLASFLEANSRAYPLEPKFELGKPVTLVSHDAIRQLVQGLEYAEECYQAVRAVYPAPQYGGWYGVSRVGFDPRTKTALLYIEQSLCGGAGNFLVLENASGAWTIKGWAIGLQSDMRLDMPPTAAPSTPEPGSGLTVTPTLQALPAGSAAQFALAVVPPRQIPPDAFYVDQLPAGWSAEFLGSPTPWTRTLVLTPAETATPGRYRFRVAATSETAPAPWAELEVEVLPCVQFQSGEFTRTMGSNPVTLITAGKPAVEHGLLVPLQVCAGYPEGRLLITVLEAISEAGTRLTSPPRFYLYPSWVWPEPDTIVAHGAPALLNVRVPRTENDGWQLQAELAPGLHLLVFERDHYGSSPDPEAIPASVTYRLQNLPPSSSPKAPTPAPALVTGSPPATVLPAVSDLVPPLLADGSGRLYMTGQVDGAQQIVALSAADTRLLTAYGMTGTFAVDPARGWLYVDQNRDGLHVLDAQTGQEQVLISLPSSQRQGVTFPAPQAAPG